MRGKYPASEVMPPAFALPPAIQKISVKLASARAAASALVAFESLTNSTPPLRPTCSMRCARPGNDTSPRWIAAVSRPSASAAPTAQAAFWALCRPRNDPIPPICAISRAVPVEMIGADIEQDADRRIERRREVDLVGRALDYVRMPAARRLEREDRGADIAAALGLMAGARQDVGEECRGGGLAVGAGDRN